MAHANSEVCKNCGLTLGAHCATSYYSDHYRKHIPYNCCPGHQGRMDWDQGPDTTFEPTGNYQDIKWDTPAKKKETQDE